MVAGRDATEFGRSWTEAWNRRDIEAVLDHFRDDAVFISPVAQKIGFADTGIVSGKQALRQYWTAALAANPDLHFELKTVFEGIDTIGIAFRTQTGVDRLEILLFKDGLVIEGRGTFAAV